MTDDVHQRALRATAKVALSLTVIGCGGTVEIEAGVGGATASGVGGADTASVVGSGGDPQRGVGGANHGVGGQGVGGQGVGGQPVAVCEPTPLGEQVSLDPQTFGCCAAELLAEPLASWGTPSEDMIACCYDVVWQVELDPTLALQIPASLIEPIGPDSGAASCCQALGSPCTIACGCTVWGPPMPRAIAFSLASLDALEVAA